MHGTQRWPKNLRACSSGNRKPHYCAGARDLRHLGFEQLDASLILASLVEVTKLTMAMESIHIEAGQWVAVEATTLGLRFAQALQSLGCKVVMMSDDASQAESAYDMVCAKMSLH